MHNVVPGVVAGAADADPTTVATLVVVGAGTVYGLSWLVLMIFPLLGVVQMIASRVGVVTGRDLQANVARSFGRPAQLLLVTSMIGVNVVTVAADLQGGAAAIGLLAGVDWRWFVVPLAAALTTLLVLGRYRVVQRVLLWVLGCLFAFVASAFLAHVDWAQVAHATFDPSFSLTPRWTTDALAVLGTAVTGYVYMWLTIEESEDASPLSLVRSKETGAWLGTLVAVVVFWFILVASGATLGAEHLQVASAADAALALRPIAGAWAGDLFGIGLLASAVVALPVIMATSAYALGAQLRWKRGLSKPIREAPGFYAVLAAGTALGVALGSAGLSPIRILFVASVVGGLGAPVGIVLLVGVASSTSLMRGRQITGALLAAGWGVAALVTAVSLVYLAQQVGVLG